MPGTLPSRRDRRAPDPRFAGSAAVGFACPAPAAAGGAGAAASFQSGGTPNALAAALLGSAEFTAIFPSDASFVQALYGDLLGRLSQSRKSR